MLKLSTRTARGDTVTLELQPGINRIGRHPDNELRFNDASVSSYHCQVTLQDGQALVQDLRSTNGTFLEGQPIEQAVLQPGQHLRLGSVDFLCEGGLDDAPEPSPEPSPPTACQRHPTEAARWICSRCRQTLCDA